MPEAHEYLYRIQLTRPAILTEGPTAYEAEIVAEHFAYLQDLLEKRVVILAGRTLNSDDTTFGIVIFNAASEEEAMSIMQHDPAIENGVMKATLFPYRIALIREANAGAQDSHVTASD